MHSLKQWGVYHVHIYTCIMKQASMNSYISHESTHVHVFKWRTHKFLCIYVRHYNMWSYIHYMYPLTMLLPWKKGKLQLVYLHYSAFIYSMYYTLEYTIIPPITLARCRKPRLIACKLATWSRQHCWEYHRNVCPDRKLRQKKWRQTGADRDYLGG